jgi:hypothetical protein
MRPFLLLAVGLVFGAALPAVAQQCTMGKVQNTTGATIRLNSGQNYMVMPGNNRSAVAFWAPLDKVQVCRAGGSSFEITNLSKTPPVTIKVLRQN